MKNGRIFLSLTTACLFLAHLSACKKCDPSGEPDTEYFPDEQYADWLPDSIPASVNFTTYTGYTDTWTRSTLNPVQDSAYFFCSGKDVIWSHYKRHTFFSILNGDLEIELQGNSGGTDLFIYLNGRTMIYNFESQTAGVFGGVNADFFYRDSFYAGGRTWNGVFEINLSPVSVTLNDNDPVKIFIARHHGLIRFELKNGVSWERI